jgi:hypothetical protein
MIPRACPPVRPAWTFYVTYFPDRWAKEYPGRHTYDVWQSAQHAWESKMDTDGFRVKIKVYPK